MYYTLRAFYEDGDVSEFMTFGSWISPLACYPEDEPFDIVSYARG